MMSRHSEERPILGKSPLVLELLKMIGKVAPTKTNVLVIGESGTGKELVARMIHDSSPLNTKAFVPVNCGAIPETLIESEMFGHKKGSFTGAVNDKQGLFEAANGGTLFLDEVGELPLGMQVKLLRAIQERVFKRVGGTDDIRVDLRIIAATNRDLEAAVAAGTFREDLYYRLNVILIRTPALRERPGDIRLLAETFTLKFAKKFGRTIKGIAPETLQLLEAFHWPGNIRELENVIERSVTLENSEWLSPESLPPQFTALIAASARAAAGDSLGASPASITLGNGAPVPRSAGGVDWSKGPIDLEQILGEIERGYLLSALEASQGVKKKAAALLGITFRSMRYRLKKLGMDVGADIEGESDE